MSKLPLGRFAAEFAVLVIGVLVALGADRWVAEIDERDRELAYLTELRVDFVRNRALAENGAKVETEMADLALELLESLGSREPVHEPARIILAAETTGWTYYATYAAGVWNDLEATGNTLVLRSGDLRVALSDFYRELEWQLALEAQLGEQISSYQVVAQRFIDPHIRLKLSESFAGWQGFSPTSLLERLDAFDVVSEATPILNAEELAAPLATAIIAHRSRSAIYGESLPQIESIMEMIEHALQD